jgi:hypothetical protein
MQSLEAPIDKPFVVKESDVEIFSFQEDPDIFDLLQEYPKRDYDGLHLTPPRLTGTNLPFLGSLCSSSPSSSICSSLNSDERKHRRKVSSRRKPKKAVSFHPKVNVRTIPKLDNLPEEEASRRWYQNCELAHIKSQVIEQIRMAKNKELPAESDEHTLRGLHMPKKQQRRSLWIMALTCVLDEQKRQARDQVSDPEILAKLYSSFAFTAKNMAQEMARLDARAVQ